VRRGRSMYTSVSAAAKRSHAEATQPKPSMTHWSRLRRSTWIFRYSSWGTLPPPALNWIASSGYSGSPVISASRRASVDFPPPALPNTATFLTRSFHYLMRSQQQRPGDGQRERPHGLVVDHHLWRAKLFNGSSSSPGGTWPTALNNPPRSISARPAVGWLRGAGTRAACAASACF